MGLRTEAVPGFVRSGAERVRCPDGGLNVDEVLDDLAPHSRSPALRYAFP